MKNITKGITTIVGVLFIISVLIFIYKGKTTFTEASGFLTIGVALLFSDDKKFIQNFFPFLFKTNAVKTKSKEGTETNE